MKVNLEPIVEYMKNHHHCHTVILYGSHARNEATTVSDIDIIGIRDQGEFQRDCHQFNGLYLDAFIYNTQAIQQPDAFMIRLRDGIILCQKDCIGDDLLAKVNKLYQAGPVHTPGWEIHEISTWLMKMLERLKMEDIEGNFRRHWLLHDVLECYFKLRKQWYLGPKESFRWLKKNDMAAYGAFEIALKPDASVTSIQTLIKYVVKTD